MPPSLSLRLCFDLCHILGLPILATADDGHQDSREARINKSLANDILSRSDQRDPTTETRSRRRSLHELLAVGLSFQGWHNWNVGTSSRFTAKLQDLASAPEETNAFPFLAKQGHRKKKTRVCCQTKTECQHVRPSSDRLGLAIPSAQQMQSTSIYEPKSNIVRADLRSVFLPAWLRPQTASNAETAVDHSAKDLRMRLPNPSVRRALTPWTHCAQRFFLRTLVVRRCVPTGEAQSSQVQCISYRAHLHNGVHES